MSTATTQKTRKKRRNLSMNLPKTLTRKKKAVTRRKMRWPPPWRQS